jgi:hypothetical protein
MIGAICYRATTGSTADPHNVKIAEHRVDDLGVIPGITDANIGITSRARVGPAAI